MCRGCIYFHRNGTINAYLDDTPVLEYARTTMDAKCQLRLIGDGFGEDGYGIGLPKASWLKVSVTMILTHIDVMANNNQNGLVGDLDVREFS